MPPTPSPKPGKNTGKTNAPKCAIPTARNPTGAIARQTPESADYADHVTHYIAPALILLIAGLAQFFLTYSRAPRYPGLSATAYVLITIAGGTTFLLIGALLSAKLRALDLGPLPIACLKLAAVSLAADATYSLAMIPLSHIPFGFLVALGLTFITYFALLGFFFSLDEDDTWYIIKIVFILKVFTFLILFWSTLLLAPKPT